MRWPLHHHCTLACACACAAAHGVTTRTHTHTLVLTAEASFCPLCIPTHQRALLNVPRVFAISLVWPRDTTTATELTATLKLLEQDLDIAELFTLVGAQSVARALCSNKCPLAVQVGDSHNVPRTFHCRCNNCPKRQAPTASQA